MIAKRSKKKDNTGKDNTAREGLIEKTQKSWEFRASKLILRIAAAIFFVSYLCLSLPLAWQWGWSAYYKSQSLHQLDSLIRQYANSEDQSELLSWINLRPEHEHEEIQSKLEPHAATLDPFIFLLFSQWAADRLDIEKTVFWHFYARYRVRFDALRCGAPDSVKNLDGIMALMPEKHITATVQRWPHLIPLSIRDVLDYDAEHPARNNPARICRIVYEIEGNNFKMVRPENWAQVRHLLRARTELSLKEMSHLLNTAPRAENDNAQEPAPENKDSE